MGRRVFAFYIVYNHKILRRVGNTFPFASLTPTWILWFALAEIWDSEDNVSDQTGRCVGQWIVLAANFARSPIVLNIFWLIWYCGILRSTGQYLCIIQTYLWWMWTGIGWWQRLYVHTKRRVAIHLGQLGICIFNCLPSVTQNSYHYPECHNANARQHSYEENVSSLRGPDEITLVDNEPGDCDEDCDNSQAWPNTALNHPYTHVVSTSSEFCVNFASVFSHWELRAESGRSLQTGEDINSCQTTLGPWTSCPVLCGSQILSFHAQTLLFLAEK